MQIDIGRKLDDSGINYHFHFLNKISKLLILYYNLKYYLFLLIGNILSEIFIVSKTFLVNRNYWIILSALLL